MTPTDDDKRKARELSDEELVEAEAADITMERLAELAAHPQWLTIEEVRPLIAMAARAAKLDAG